MSVPGADRARGDLAFVSIDACETTDNTSGRATMKINDDGEFDDQRILVRKGKVPFVSRSWAEIPLAQLTAIELKRFWPGVIGDLLGCFGGLILLSALVGNYVRLHPDANGVALIALCLAMVILFNAVRSFFINWVLLVSTAERQWELGANTDRSYAKAIALKDQLMIAVHKAIARERL